MEATQTEQTVDKAKQQPTEYVVLQRQAGDSETDDERLMKHWVEMGRAKGVNAQAAIKKVATADAGTYIAVPARSWKPMTRKTETVQKEIWS